MNARAVIFDMDGLLLDTEPFYRHAWQEAARRLGHELGDETFRSFSGRSDADAEAALLEALGPSFPLGDFQRSWPGIWHQAAAAREVPVKSGIRELLAELRSRSVPAAVATSSPAARTELALRAARIAEHFAHVVTGESVRRAKPAPDIFLEAARRLGVTASACIVLEDSDTGARAAAAAGMRVVVIPDGRAPAGETLAIATAVHASAGEALPTLRALLGA
jgi:HAD superfamily hydrolase (TIGR01509 family)